MIKMSLYRFSFQPDITLSDLQNEGKQKVQITIQNLLLLSLFDYNRLIIKYITPIHLFHPTCHRLYKKVALHDTYL